MLSDPKSAQGDLEGMGERNAQVAKLIVDANLQILWKNNIIIND